MLIKKKNCQLSKDSEISIGTFLLSLIRYRSLKIPQNVTTISRETAIAPLLNNIATSPKCIPGYTRANLPTRMASIAFHAHTESYLWEASSCRGGRGERKQARRTAGKRCEGKSRRVFLPCSPSPFLPFPPPRRARASRGYGFITRQ